MTCGDEQASAEQEGDVLDANSMFLLFIEGLLDDTELVVWYCVGVRNGVSGLVVKHRNQR
jgi:hypothetical protein